MLEIKDIISKLNSYNLNNSYNPLIYKNKDKLGLVLDIKDSTFDFLTRAFTFDNIDALDEFLNKYSWYRSDKNIYNITLSFDDYITKEPTLIYTYQNNELSFQDMLNLKETIQENNQNKINANLKNAYLLNIENLTNYLINIINNNNQIKQEKNQLKIMENDLKYNLLKVLSIYYGKNKDIPKKGVTLDTNIILNNNIEKLKNGLINLNNQDLNYIENYLKNLIAETKKEELDEKNIINNYSYNVYKYNIEILKKQIEFVNSKITAEKNFNLKNSKIHNIDAELKSFLKTKNAPPKLEEYLNNTKNFLNTKYNSISSFKEAYSKISGNTLTIPELPKNKINKSNIESLNAAFNLLSTTEQRALILYNSFYKKIINYIIDNNYPEIKVLKKEFDMSYYYEELEDIIYNEQNVKYYKYFNIIDFKNIDNYLNSLINIAKTIDNIKILLNSKLNAFTLNNSNTYKELNLNPLFTDNSYLITINENTNIIFIPYKFEIDNNEIDLITTNNIYYKGNITLKDEYITVNKYQKKIEKDKKNGIIITTELELTNTTNFKLGEIKP